MADISATKRMDTSKIYYASQEEVQAARDRANRKRIMKAEFQKKVTHPMRGLSEGGYIVSLVYTSVILLN